MRSLSTVGSEELIGKSFELVLVDELLCEVCAEPLGSKEKRVRMVQILSRRDYENLLNRASVHCRAEIDFEKGRIYFVDRDFPGDVHAECIEKL